MAKPAAAIFRVVPVPVTGTSEGEAEAAPVSEPEVRAVVADALVKSVLLPAGVGYGAVVLATMRAVVAGTRGRQS